MDSLIEMIALFFDKLNFRIKSVYRSQEEVNDVIRDLIRIRIKEVDNIKKARESMINFERFIQAKEKTRLINGKLNNL